MVFVQPNLSYASVASRNFKLKEFLPTKNYTFLSPYPQCFTFPYDVIRYLLKTPKSSNGLLKLYQTCKYFYFKREIIIVSCELEFFFDTRFSYKFKNENFKILRNSALWLTEEFVIDQPHLFDFTKIYRSTIKTLFILNAKMTMKEFKFLLAEKTVETFCLSNRCRIKTVNNQKASINAILQLLPNIKKFYYFNTDENYTKNTLKKMIATKMNKKLQNVMLAIDEVAEDFDANLLFKFIKKNAEIFSKISIIPIGEDREELLLILKTAEEKFKSFGDWKNKKIAINFTIPS